MSDYQQEWESYRKLWNPFVTTFVGQIAIIIGFICFAAALRRNLALGLTLESFWTLLFIVASIRLQNFRCPRCREKFCSSGFYHNVFVRQCLNCGLPKYSS
jgi:hypothetical protein